ncbi:D(3) dopamine receptor-like [Liolophura sinensis]|uniref:D(3) dopamine receptor-like n=1 Tax=Liolophura sinensis TaxID=3198878 RepID=UPI00315962ED
MSASNSTTEDVAWNDSDRLLRQLNDDKARLYIPVVLYILILLVTGVIGNSLVLYVYLKRFKRTSSNYFILSMAMFDMVVCCIGMPTEIYDLRYPYMFYNNAACKILRYTESVPIIGSALILVAVAFDRYFKICRPLRNTPLRYIKKICIAIAIFAVLTTIPTIFVFGLKDVETNYTDVVGKDCSTLKKNGKSTLLSFVWYGYLSVVFVLCTCTMIGLYIRIWLEIKHRQRQALGRQVSKISTEDSGLPESPTALSPTQKPASDSKIERKQNFRVKYLPSVSISSEPDSGGLRTGEARANTLGRLGSNTSDGMDPEKKSLRQIGENVMTKIRASKTTVILFVVTLAFILSYLPTLIVTVIRSKDTRQRSDTVDFLMKLFSKSYFINNSINPIIYSFLNINFRMECAKALARLSSCCFCCCRSNSRSVQFSKKG